MRALLFGVGLVGTLYANPVQQACYVHSFNEHEEMTICFKSDSTYIINETFYGKYYFADSMLYMTDSSDTEYRAALCEWKERGKIFVTTPMNVDGISLEFRYTGHGN